MALFAYRHATGQFLAPPSWLGSQAPATMRDLGAALGSAAALAAAAAADAPPGGARDAVTSGGALPPDCCPLLTSAPRDVLMLLRPARCNTDETHIPSYGPAAGHAAGRASGNAFGPGSGCRGCPEGARAAAFLTVTLAGWETALDGLGDIVHTK